jgi:hypothetical protein
MANPIKTDYSSSDLLVNYQPLSITEILGLNNNDLRSVDNYDYIDPVTVYDPSAFQPKEKAPEYDPNMLTKAAATPAKRDAKYQPIKFDARGAERYTQSDYFSELGYIPWEDNESRYGYRQTWGNVLGNALAGGAALAAQTFVEGWKGWGDMADALFSWDSSKLVGSDQELMKLYNEQKRIMDKYAIFSTPESQESIFNRQFFGNMLQQGGFAIGALAQFASEELLTLGASTALSSAKLGLSLGRLGARTVKTAELTRDLARLGSGIYKSEKIVNAIVSGAKKFIPLLNTADDIRKLHNAGAGVLQMAYVGAGGVKRALAEANMAFTEARMEAAGTYGDLVTRLEQEFIDTNGRVPGVDEMDKIRQTAREAAGDNFAVNSGILLLANRLQFDNVFSKFAPKRRLLREMGRFGDDVLKVTGKSVDDASKTVTKVYDKSGLLGTGSTFKEIAADFGKKRAAWELTKATGKGILKWEASEGVQELLQETSNKGLQNYYYQLYHGYKGADWSDSMKEAAKDQFTMDGMKTFLMGALTGRLLSPITYGTSKLTERIRTSGDQRNQIKSDRADTINILNEFYTDPKKFLNEAIATVKVQHKAGQLMDMAVDDRNQYEFHNTKDSSLAQLVSAAKKTDMLETILDTIKDYSDIMTVDDMKAFNINATQDNVVNVKSFFNDVVEKIKSFSTTWETLQDKYGSTVMPDIYDQGTENHKNAILAKAALDEAIQILATNKFNGQRALERAVEIYNQVSVNKAVGGSASTTFKHLGSTVETDRQIGLLESELKGLRANPQPDKQARELINQKEKQLEILKNWKENWESLKDYTPDKLYSATKAVKAYKEYILSQNEQAGLQVDILEEDIQDTYQQLIDYIELNKDHKDYVDAYNILSNPNQFSKLHGRIKDAIEKVSEVFQKEHEMEINQEELEFDSEDSLDGIDPFELFGDLENEEETSSGSEESTDTILPDLEHPPVDTTAAEEARTNTKVGNYDISVGDKINGQEVVKITNEYITLEKSGNKTPDEIAALLKPFNGKNLVKKDSVTVQPQPKKILENGEIENIQDVESIANNQNINKLIIEKNPKVYRDSDKVIRGGDKINTNSDIYVVTPDPLQPRKRVGPNPEYNILMGTPVINVGTPITLRAETDIEEFKDNHTNKKYTAADFFDGDKIKEGMVNEFPVGIYTTINGKETKLGNLPTISWVTRRKDNGETMNVLEFITNQDGSKTNNLKEQVKVLENLRNKIYSGQNSNQNFTLSAIIDNKSEGKLRTTVTPGKLKERLHSNTKLGIIKGGAITLSNDTQLDLPEEQVISNFDYRGKEGWPVALLNTPTGRTLVTYVNVPKLNENFQNIIIDSWKAFHAVKANPNIAKNSDEFKIVGAIYEAYGTQLGENEQVDFNVLRGYINDYVTFLSGERYDPLKEGKSQLSITPDGQISLWHVETKDINEDSVFADSIEELDRKLDVFKKKLSNVYHNVRLSSDTAVGINSPDIKSFLTYTNGKISVTNPQTYNEYVMGILETRIDKGTPVNPKDKNSELVYFANPVVTFDQIEEVELPVEETVETVTTSKPKEIKDIKYARYADTGDGFTVSDLMKEPDGEAIFQINELSATEAEYVINPEAVKYALSNASFFFNKTVKNLDDSFGSNIFTIKPGKLRKDGNKWTIVERAEVSQTEEKPQFISPSELEFAEIPTSEELDLNISFGKTIFETGDFDEADLKSIRTVKNYIDKQDIKRDCK